MSNLSVCGVANVMKGCVMIIVILSFFFHLIGSEADSVVYGVSGSKKETWRHVYTAVTRGKKMVTILGTKADLHAAVNRKPRWRQTALKEKIMEILPKKQVLL